MSDRVVHHSTFTIERTYDASPARVWKAWSQPEAKALWFGGGDDWRSLVAEMDFRVGGTERARGEWRTSGTTTDFVCRYLDIVPEQRLIYSYDMYVNDQKLSVSLATIELFADGARTKLVLTEQGAYLDGGADDAGNRERGTAELMDALGASLTGA